MPPLRTYGSAARYASERDGYGHLVIVAFALVLLVTVSVRAWEDHRTAHCWRTVDGKRSFFMDDRPGCPMPAWLK